LYLLLLLSQQDYLGFHMALESLELLAASSAEGGSKMVESEYIRYPVRLERALMEGSYDRVWGETTGQSIPGEEFGVFSEVCLWFWG
jgi:26S proteasome regulatory subunit N12